MRSKVILCSHQAFLIGIVLLCGTRSSAQIPLGSLETTLRITDSFDPIMPGVADFELTPTDLIPLHDGTGRLLLATLGGTLRMLDSQGHLFQTPVLTTSQLGLQLQEESGTTGIAVHPDFNSPGTFGHGKLYTISTENSNSRGGLPNASVDFFLNNEVHQDIIREWDLSAIAGNAAINSLPELQLSDSREILRVDQPGPYHDIYDLSFNPYGSPGSDDYGQLYITAGDGGGASSVSQDRSNIYGNILRINPDPTAHSLVRTSQNSGLPAYSISPLNPFNGDDPEESTNRNSEGDTLAEIFAYGIRSPYRIGFDRANGDTYIGDVGSSVREEINRIESGQNYGWPNREGTTGTQPPGGSVDPLFEYRRSEGRTVVGGFVYRGSAIPDLVGKYVFAEFGQLRDHARLFYGIVDEDDPDGDVGDFFEFPINPAGATFPIDTSGDFIPDSTGMLPDRIFSLGEDTDGEIYLVAGQDPRGLAPSVPGAFLVKLVNPADYNFDSDVDGDDFLQWQRGDSPDSLSADDLSDWLRNFGAGDISASGPITTLQSVPEPSGLVAIVCGAMLYFAGRRAR